MEGKKVVLGLSGGVDSSACAYLLKNMGYEVHGLFLAYGRSDASPALRAAKELGIDIEVRDITRELEEKVISPFIKSYLEGETPNPCVICNPLVKFRALADEALRLGAQNIATGHYAIARGGKLYRSESPKDQSYMLYRLPKDIIDMCVFPLGEIEDKSATRAVAERAGLSSSSTPDSMEICFISEGSHSEFIEKRGRVGKSGNFVDIHGNVLGPHEGIHHYTVGQRRGLGIAASGRLYVKSINVQTGDVILDFDDPKEKSIYIHDICFTDPEYSGIDSFECMVRVRHSKRFEKAVCRPYEGCIDFELPVRAPSPGQSAVCYGADGQVLCGGFIRK